MKLQNILAFGLGPIASAAFGLITIPIVAWVFSPEDVGRLNILQVTLSFCLLLTTLGMDQAYVREFHETPEHAPLLKATFLPGFVFLFICLAILIPFREYITQQLFGNENSNYFWITLACAIVTYIARFISLILRMEERGLAFSLSQIIQKALLLLFVGIIIIAGLERNFTSLSQAFFISSAAVIFIYTPFTYKHWRAALAANLHRTQVLKYFQFGLPLVISGLAYWGLIASSTIALRSISTLSELGVYAIATSIAGVAAIFQTIFTVVWAPIVYKWVASGVDPSRIDRIANKALAIVCSIFCLCGMFSWITDFLLPEHYSSVKYLVLCAIVQPLLYTLSEITCVGIGISRRSSLTIWVTLSSLVVNILLCLWLVPLHGAGGALVANAIAFLVFFIARTEASAIAWRQFPRARLYVFATVAVTLSIFTVLAGKDFPIHFSYLWAVMTPVIIFSLRAEIQDMAAITSNAIKRR